MHPDHVVAAILIAASLITLLVYIPLAVRNELRRETHTREPEYETVANHWHRPLNKEQP